MAPPPALLNIYCALAMWASLEIFASEEDLLAEYDQICTELQAFSSQMASPVALAPDLADEIEF